jgi:S1-C subfamily serine protease
MKRALILVTVWVLVISANAQKVLTRKEIYRINCEAVVQIYVNDIFSGTGFIASADGVVMTANHVVTKRDSGFRQYATDIKVLVFRNGKAAPYPATPVSAQVSDDQTNYDSAVLKIAASGLPHVILGNWDEIDIADPLLIIPSFPGIGCIMLEGIVSSKAAFQTSFGPKLVNTILFQSPVRNGFSGSPIFSLKGRVVGIEDTKVFGIAPALDALRTKWASTSSKGKVLMFGIDVPASFVELINNLDLNLISGLGSGVDIGYAKQEKGGKIK